MQPPLPRRTGAYLLVITAILAGCAPAPPTASAIANPIAASCTLADNAFISQADLGPFQRMVDEHLGAAPVKGGAPGAPRPNYVTDFLDGSLRGYIADFAVDGPDRPLEDAMARSRNYPVGKWPLVPLSGPVIRDGHGLLEVYEYQLGFSNHAAAEGFAGWLAQANSDSPTTRVRVPGPSSAPDGYSWMLGANDGSNEQVIEFRKVVGSEVMRLDLQGTPDLFTERAGQLSAIADMRFMAACSS